MEPSSNYTVERMREIGRSSTDRAWANLERSIVGRLTALTCDYLGILNEGGAFSLPDKVRVNTSVAYQWTVTGDGFSEAHVATVRVDKAVANGVAWPKGWRSALRNLDLPDITKQHLGRVKAESTVPGLGCRLLGAPVSVALSHTGETAGATCTLRECYC